MLLNLMKAKQMERRKRKRKQKMPKMKYKSNRLLSIIAPLKVRKKRRKIKKRM